MRDLKKLLTMLLVAAMVVTMQGIPVLAATTETEDATVTEVVEEAVTEEVQEIEATEEKEPVGEGESVTSIAVNGEYLVNTNTTAPVVSMLNGAVSYHRDNNTLYLKDATVSSPQAGVAAINIRGPLNMVLQGENTVTGMITVNDALTVDAVEGGSLTETDAEIPLFSSNAASGSSSLTILGGTYYCDYFSFCYGDFTMTGGTVISQLFLETGEKSKVTISGNSRIEINYPADAGFYGILIPLLGTTESHILIDGDAYVSMNNVISGIANVATGSSTSDVRVTGNASLIVTNAQENSIGDNFKSVEIDTAGLVDLSGENGAVSLSGKQYGVRTITLGDRTWQTNWTSTDSGYTDKHIVMENGRVVTQESIPTELFVNGVDILKAVDNRVVSGNGYASYDEATNTLELNNMHITEGTSYVRLGNFVDTAGILSDGDISIRLVGNSDFALPSSNCTGIATPFCVTFGGDGALDLTGKYQRTLVVGSFEVTDTADVELVAADGFVMWIVRNISQTQFKAGGEIYEDQMAAAMRFVDGKLVKQWNPPYNVKINNKTVTCPNAGETIYENGNAQGATWSMTCQGDDTILTLNNFHSDYAISARGDLTVELQGDNAIENENDKGIYTNGNLTLMGEGNLFIYSGSRGLNARNIDIQGGTCQISSNSQAVCAEESLQISRHHVIRRGGPITQLINGSLKSNLETADSIQREGAFSFSEDDGISASKEVELGVEYTISANAGEGGTITPGGKTVITSYNGEQKYSISANEGYVIQDVLVDGESVGIVNEYTFSDIADDHTIAAKFQSTAKDPDKDPDQDPATDLKAYPLSANEISFKAKKTTCTYTGSPLTPAMLVKSGKTTLKQNIDYLLTYHNNVNCGSSAYVTITGIGEYGGSIRKNFTITPKSFKKATIEPMANIAYDADAAKMQTAAEANLVVKDGTKELTQGKDYTVLYNGEAALKANAGDTVTVSIKGISGNYIEEASKKITKFKVIDTANATDISGAVLALKSTKPITYTGKALKPAMKVTLSGNDGKLIKLKANKDYKLVYSGNINAGKGKVRLIGIGKYYGTVSTEFEIGQKTLKKVTVANIPNQYYTGKPITALNLTVKANGTLLRQGTDYTVSFNQTDKVTNKKSGIQASAVITLQPNDNYIYDSKIQTVTKNFKVVKGRLNSKSAVVAVSESFAGDTKDVTVTYNGNTLVPTTNGKDGDYKITIKSTRTGYTVTVKGLNNFTGSKVLKVKK